MDYEPGKNRFAGDHHPPTLAADIVDTVREPMLVLDRDLRVQRANSSFYHHFHVVPEETISQMVYELGNGQWNIPALRELLNNVLPENELFNDFEVRHTFESIGQRSLLLNARRIDHLQLILLAMEDITERREAEETIGHAARFLEENPSPVLRAGEDGILLYANPPAVSLLAQWKCRVGDAVPEFVQEELVAALAEGKSRDLEVRCDERHLAFVLVPIPGQGYVNLYGSDITERKQVEDALRQKELRQSFLVGLADALRPLADPVALQAEATRALGEHLGASRVLYAEILDDANTAVVDADYCREGTPSVVGRHLLCDFDPFVSETLKAGRTLVLADFGEMPDMTSGERTAYGAVDTQAHITVPLVKEGRLTALLSVQQAVPRTWSEGEVALVEEVAELTWADVERARVEKALRESEERYRSLFESIDQGFCIVEMLIDTNGSPSDYRYLDVNRVFEAQTGITNAVGRCMREIVPAHEKYWFDIYGRVALTGEPVRFQKPAEALGRFFDVFAFRVDEPEKRHVALLFNDITDRNQAEVALREAKAAAEEASRAKSEFLANMSHEIRTPMTGFLAALEHLLQIESNPEHRHLLVMADKSARRLRALIDEILDFSKIEARRVELEEEPFDLRNCVREAVEMFALPAQEKNLRLETDVSPNSPPIVVGDPHKLNQVLTNLIGNAVKFTHDGEVRVSLQSRGDFLEFSVADTGIGIPEEKCHLLFESFSQLDASFHREFGGSGLGLAISKGLVELMGGRIEVRSREGGGSLFIFSLPLQAAESLGSKPLGILQEDSGGGIPATRILLAEDDAMIQELITLVLAQRGWHAESAATGLEAIEKWEKGGFDIVLMDLQMPDMDGLEATQAIRGREIEVGRRTCIIGLTAHARIEIRNDCLRAGMNEVLTKPVQMRDLYSAIDRCLLE
jgi:PAS domain S-box-containing protein